MRIPLFYQGIDSIMKKQHTSVIFGVLGIFVFALTMATFANNAIAATPEKQQAGTSTDKQSQTAGEYFDDSIITTDVKSKILAEKGLSSLDISVKTIDGVVTLSGKTDTAEHIQIAELVAKQVNGVKRVVNELQVDGKTAQPAGAYLDDSAITAAVKANILKEKGLASMDISVKSLEGAVTLSGTTDTAEHSQLAERVAKQTNGVKRVVNELKIK